MPPLPKHVKEKGFFICTGHKPCADELPRSAITEWLELCAPCGSIAEVDYRKDGTKILRYRNISDDKRSNLQWALDEIKRLSRTNGDASMGYVLRHSEDGRFVCICKACSKEVKKSLPSSEN